MEKLPTFAVDLVVELDKLYPERCPAPDWSFRKVWLEAGKREIVRYLLALKEATDGTGER